MARKKNTVEGLENNFGTTDFDFTESKNRSDSTVTLTNEQLAKMLEDSNRKAVEAALEAFKSAQPQKIQITEAPREMVGLTWMADVSPDNVVEFGENGKYARIVGDFWKFKVPKDELYRIINDLTRTFIERRWLVCSGGLTRDEKEDIWGKGIEDEIIKPENFSKIAKDPDFDDCFSKLCDGHKQIFASKMGELYRAGDKSITRERVDKLNEQSKTSDCPKGLFYPIILAMNDRDAGI